MMIRALSAARRMVVAGTGLIAVAAGAHAEPRDFRLDPEHASITFFVTHLGFADVAGLFTEAEGEFTFDEEAQSLQSMEVRIKSDSLFTGHEERDGHLRSPDFLNVEEYPEIVFVATKAENLGHSQGRITGDLTLLGVTKPVTLEATFNKGGNYPFLDQHYAVGVDAVGSFKRSDFGMTYGLEDDMVGDEVKLVFGIEGIREE